MKMRKRAVLLVAAAAVMLAVAVPVATSAPGPGEIVKVKSTLTLSKEGWFGYVKSKNSNCLADRKVVIKQAGNGPIGRAKSDASGKWTGSIEEMNEHFDIELPSRIYAEVKPITQATAGPIYKCLAATSKTITL